MFKLKKRKESVKKGSESVEEHTKDLNEKEPFLTREIDPKLVVSTGSTLLDLNISGKRRRGGGVPAGIVMEIFGPSGTGKTALAAEISTSIQIRGGVVRFEDPEARLDKEYATIYGVNLQDKFWDYGQPDTVTEMFQHLEDWKPDNIEVINGFVGDSIAALSTKMEMDEGDKMGMRRAKEFSQELRRWARLIQRNNYLVVFVNQIRQGQYGEESPGGQAIRFYSSLRIRVGPPRLGSRFIDKEKQLDIGKEGKKKKLKKPIGIKSTARVVKSSVDDPFRECDLYILFGYGIDDIRGNLQFIKEVTGDTRYDVFDKKMVSIDQACKFIEKHNLVKRLRNKTIDLWEEIESQFDLKRKPKTRI